MTTTPYFIVRPSGLHNIRLALGVVVRVVLLRQVQLVRKLVHLLLQLQGRGSFHAVLFGLGVVVCEFEWVSGELRGDTMQRSAM
jgi:hypothetical protein